MYLRSIRIDHLRSIAQLTWRLSDKHPGAGWHVILGDNGSGKSSFLQAVALALVGPQEALALRQDFNEWLQVGSDTAKIELQIIPHREDRWQERGRHDTKITADIQLKRSDTEKRLVLVSSRQRLGKGPYRALWGERGGWFSAGFGPFRRFIGGESDTARLFWSNPNLAPHLSLFSEGVALSEGLAWLCKLHNRARDNRGQEAAEEARLLDYLQHFINTSGLLPSGVTLCRITAETVEFRDAAGCEVPVMTLSDGFRAVLSLSFELLRLMNWCFGTSVFLRHATQADTHQEAPAPPVINLPGVVLIDEVDAHLHPIWQHRIGDWFKRSFPRVQFLVATHSPIVCQAAAGGSVYKLPAPGSGEQGRMIEGTELKRLIYGSVLDAFRTSAFSPEVTRSAAASKLIEALGVLNVKEIAEGLSPEEQAQQQELRRILPGLDPY